MKVEYFKIKQRVPVEISPTLLFTYIMKRKIEKETDMGTDKGGSKKRVPASTVHSMFQK